jgi:hypothetical protein
LIGSNSRLSGRSKSRARPSTGGYALAKGPEEIRAGDGLYFAHGKACPAYDETGRSCRVYGQEIKPLGCSDFPVYEDRGSVIADLRCEAVDLKALATWMARSVGRGFRIVQSADEEFPFLVSLSVKRVAGQRCASAGAGR